MRRILAAAGPEVRARVFADQAREYVNWFILGLMEKATVIDALQAVGEEFGLGVEVIQQALVAAIDDPLTIRGLISASASDERNHHPEATIEDHPARQAGDRFGPGDILAVPR